MKQVVIGEKLLCYLNGKSKDIDEIEDMTFFMNKWKIWDLFKHHNENKRLFLFFSLFNSLDI